MFVQRLHRICCMTTPTTTARATSRSVVKMSSTKIRDPPKNPLILIMGATGTGKSNLALSLASYLTPRSEIINADAMQLYRGMPIITNKLPLHERQNIPHHLLDHIPLDQEPWTVSKFVQECDKVIDEIRGRGKIPVVVGGTGYYVHGLLMRDATLEADLDKDEATEQGTGIAAEDRWSALEASTEELYAKLQEVDPAMATRWHPKDRRKIQRSLEIYLKTGKKASEVYEEQQRRRCEPEDRTSHELNHESTDVTANQLDEVEKSQLRYSPLIFWMDAEDAALKERLNARVDTMIEGGLLEEALEMGKLAQELQERGQVVDKTKGIWVSIGYKELEPWIEATLDKNNQEEKALTALRDSCIESVKAGTRRYAKRQNRYIRIRFANVLADAHASDSLFLLDCTDLARWHEAVERPAREVVDKFLKGEQLPDPTELSGLAHKMLSTTNNDGKATVARAVKYCETCNKTVMTEQEWSKHISSRSHKKILQGIRKRQENMAWLAANVSKSDEHSGKPG